MESFLRVIKLGYNNFWRHRWLTIGATLLMTLTLTMISISLLITLIIRDTTEAVREKISLTIYFRNDAISDERILMLRERIKQLPDVISVDFIDKKRALEIFKRLPINEDIKQPLGEEYNPLPRSLEIKTADVEQLEIMKTRIESADSEKIICSTCVSIDRNKEVVDRLVRGTRTIQWIGWLFGLFFGLIAIFNVYNIIRLTIQARADEIEIMRFVGASNTFTRGPFIVEGIMYGLIATTLTTLFIPILIKIVSVIGSARGFGVSDAIGVLGTDLSSYVLTNLPTLIVVQLIVGVVLGVAVSLFSIRKYLRA